MKYKDLKLGKEYTFDEICEIEDVHENNIQDYGQEIIGENGVRIQESKNYNSAWFILNSANSKGYYYKLVYIQ